MLLVCPACTTKNRVPDERLRDEPVCGRCQAPLAPPAPVALDDRTASLRHALSWTDLLPSIGSGLWVVALFAAGMLLAREFATPLQQALSENTYAGIAVFVATSALAVLVPLLTNLPLLPIAVLAWGPWWSALLLLLGWVAGAALSFALGRHARRAILRRSRRCSATRTSSD